MSAAEVVLEIGALDGPVETVFGRISGIAQDVAGRIFVADLQADEIRVFDPQGEYLFTVANRGQGPGEVAAPCCLAIGPNGDLWVRDMGNARYQAFDIGDSSSTLTWSLRMAQNSSRRWAPITFIADTLVDVGMKSAGSEGAQLSRVMLLPGGGERRTETMHQPSPEELGGKVIRGAIGEARFTFFFSPPFGPRYLSAHGPGGIWADAISDAHEVRIYGTYGDTVVIDLDMGAGPLLSDSEKERAKESLAGDRKRAGDQAGQLDWRVPDRAQPLAQLFFDVEGRLWIERATPEGAQREAGLYSSDGQPLETRTWPRAVRLGLPGLDRGPSSAGTETRHFGRPKCRQAGVARSTEAFPITLVIPYGPYRVFDAP